MNRAIKIVSNEIFKYLFMSITFELKTQTFKHLCKFQVIQTVFNFFIKHIINIRKKLLSMIGIFYRYNLKIEYFSFKSVKSGLF
jgi:hypothetical protein